MLGEAAVAMWFDVGFEPRVEFDDWHAHEHMRERLSLPGLLRRLRWVAMDAACSTFGAGPSARTPTRWPLDREYVTVRDGEIEPRLHARGSAGGVVLEFWYSLYRKFVIERGKARLPWPAITGKANGTRPDYAVLERIWADAWRQYA